MEEEHSLQLDLKNLSQTADILAQQRIASYYNANLRYWVGMDCWYNFRKYNMNLLIYIGSETLLSTQ